MTTSLAGIRVLDLSRVLAGPWASQLLGDYGADVIKLERPGRGDDTRGWGPPWLSDKKDAVAAYYLAANRNKRSITVDLANLRGQAVVRDLAREADVVLENFLPGTMTGFGLDYANLSAVNPGLVYCSITAFGSDSSLGMQPGYDAMIQASAGLMSVTGAADAHGGEPQKVGIAISDIMAGMYAVTAILAALHARHALGRGQYVEVPLYDSQVAWLANQGMNYLVGGENPQRLGNAHPNIVPYQSFRTADSHLVLAVGNDRQFADCMECLGLAELATDPRYHDNAARVLHRNELVQTLADVFVNQDTSYWLKHLADKSVPAGPINSIADVFTSDYVRERELVRRLAHPLDKQLPSIANPVRMSVSDISYDRAPPLLGQHTREVLRDWLGYSDADFSALRASGAIGNDAAQAPRNEPVLPQ